MADDRIHFKCIEVQQPIGTFHIGAIPAADVLAIAYADIRRIEQRDIERIVGIQRELSEGRVKEIATASNPSDRLMFRRVRA